MFIGIIGIVTYAFFLDLIGGLVSGVSFGGLDALTGFGRERESVVAVDVVTTIVVQVSRTVVDGPGNVEPTSAVLLTSIQDSVHDSRTSIVTLAGAFSEPSMRSTEASSSVLEPIIIIAMASSLKSATTSESTSVSGAPTLASTAFSTSEFATESSTPSFLRFLVDMRPVLGENSIWSTCQ